MKPVPDDDDKTDRSGVFLVRKANVSDIPKVLPLFQAYRLFCGHNSDEKQCKTYIRNRLRRNQSSKFSFYSLASSMEGSACILLSFVFYFTFHDLLQD